MSESSTELAALPDNKGIERAALSKDGKWLAYADDKKLHLFDLILTTEVATYNLSTRLDHGDGELVFSDDGKLLAYEDVEGLHIVSTINLAVRLSLRNNLRGLDDLTLPTDSITSYHPLAFSPNNQWLIVDEGKWEAGWPRLLSLSTGELFRLNDCMGNMSWSDKSWDMSWSADSRTIFGAVAFSGYMGCGEEPGIYTVDVGSGSPIEKRIYYEFSEDYPYQRDPTWVDLSPDGDWISFTYFSRPTDFGHYLSRLLLVSVNGKEGRELERADVLHNPLWAEDSRSVYFVRLDNSESELFQVDINSWEEERVTTIAHPIALLSILPDANKLLFSECTNYCQNYIGLFLLDLKRFTVEKIEQGEIHFLGWEQLN